MERKPYTAAEKARIVAKGEARLGVQHFIGVIAERISVVEVLETLEQKVEKAEDKFHALYTQAFAKAVANLRSNQSLEKL